ncbi:unnamed protein product, partial [Prorocentrum cordatum]
RRLARRPRPRARCGRRPCGSQAPRPRHAAPGQGRCWLARCPARGTRAAQEGPTCASRPAALGLPAPAATRLAARRSTPRPRSSTSCRTSPFQPRSVRGSTACPSRGWSTARTCAPSAPGCTCPASRRRCRSARLAAGRLSPRRRGMPCEPSGCLPTGRRSPPGSPGPDRYGRTEAAGSRLWAWSIRARTDGPRVEFDADVCSR